MFVPPPIVRKNFAAISTKIYEKPTRTGFRLAGPRDNPTTAVLDDYRCCALRLARNHQRHPTCSVMTVFRWLAIGSHCFEYQSAVAGGSWRPRPAAVHRVLTLTLTFNIRDFETELSENKDALRTRLRENETTIFENRPRTSAAGPD